MIAWLFAAWYGADISAYTGEWADALAYDNLALSSLKI